MKVFFLALFVAAVAANPAPLDNENGEPVDLIINGVADGEALDIGDIVDIKLKEHVDGEIAAVSNLLYPFSSQGLAEAASVVNAEVVDSVPIEVVQPSEPVLIPEPIVLPQPVLPEVIPSPVIVAPEVNTPEIIPEPVVVVPEAEIPGIIPEPVIVVPEATPEIVAEPVQVVDTPLSNGEIFNDGVVQVTLNTPEETGVLATLQSWFSMALSYISGGIQTTQQIV